MSVSDKVTLTESKVDFICQCPCVPIHQQETHPTHSSSLIYRANNIHHSNLLSVLVPSLILLTLHPPFTSIFNLRPPSPSGTHCGYLLPPLVVSASDTISVSFTSDSRLTDRGFSAKWEAVYPEDIAGTKDLHTHRDTHIETHTETHSHLRHIHT